MDGAAGVLVIILAAFLALFLILATILTVMLIRVTKQIRAITTSAQKAAEGVERTIANISLAGSLAAISKAVAGVMKKPKKK